MPDDFEVALEKLVADHARALAQDVTALILGRLGIAKAPAVGRAAPTSSNRGGKVKSLPKPGRAKRTRLSSRERDDVVERVASAVTASDGVSSGEVERLTKLTRSQVVAALRALKESGRIFMAGDKRLARYGATRAVAERASSAAARS